ncbi:MAG: hypothetical protein V1911_04330 [Candidatus Micrarchaeota archaeon]
MAECPSCGAETDIENIALGKTIKCPGCGVKLEVVKEGKKKELYETEIEYEE